MQLAYGCSSVRGREQRQQGPHEGAAEPRGAQGAAGKAAAWPWAPAGNSELCVSSFAHHRDPGPGVWCGPCYCGCFRRSWVRPPEERSS